LLSFTQEERSWKEINNLPGGGKAHLNFTFLLYGGISIDGMKTLALADRFSLEERLKKASQIFLSSVAARKFGDAKLDFTRELTQGRIRLSSKPPRFHVKPLAELPQR